MIRLAIVIAFVFGVSACGQANERYNSQPVTSEEFVSSVVPLFPAGTEVTLLVFPDGAAIGDDDRIQNLSARTAKAHLTVAQRQQLTQLVRTAAARPPDAAVDACAHVYRHVFVFHDTQERELGYLAVCLECHGAFIRDWSAAEAQGLHYGYSWDAAIVADIAEAHGLPTFQAEAAE